MSGATVEVETADGLADSYLARPDDRRPRAGVLLVMDAFGLRPRIEEMADRIASRGYVVLAPNVFYRAGRAPVLPMPDFSDQGNRGEFMQAVRPLMQQLDPESIGRDGTAYLDFLAHEVAGKAAITGYCMGGRVGWRIAAAHPERVGALASFHGGGLVTEAADSPHATAARLRGIELYFGHADRDQSMSREQIAALEQTLDAVGVRYRSELYEGALHGYTMSDTAVYDEAASERHFEALFALLDRAAIGSDG